LRHRKKRLLVSRLDHFKPAERKPVPTGGVISSRVSRKVTAPARNQRSVVHSVVRLVSEAPIFNERIQQFEGRNFRSEMYER
jgi:hypothetical protein